MEIAPAVLASHDGGDEASIPSPVVNPSAASTSSSSSPRGGGLNDNNKNKVNLNNNVSNSSKYDDDDDEEDVCRICRNPGDAENPLRYPCACSGSIKFVHQDCLLQWLNHSNARQCEVCSIF